MEEGWGRRGRPGLMWEEREVQARGRCWWWRGNGRAILLERGTRGKHLDQRED